MIRKPIFKLLQLCGSLGLLCTINFKIYMNKIKFMEMFVIKILF